MACTIVNDMHNGQRHVQGSLACIFINVVYSGQLAMAFTMVKIMYTYQCHVQCSMSISIAIILRMVISALTNVKYND